MNADLTTVTHYGIDRKFKTVEYGAVSLARAREVVKEQFAKLKPRYESAEEAIAETMFGFARGEKSFIEICLNGPDQISFKFENPYRKPFLMWQVPALFQKSIVLNSSARLDEEVTLFFTSSLAEYQVHFADLS